MAGVVLEGEVRGQPGGEEGRRGWENPGPERKQSSQHCGLYTVPQCRPAAPSETERCSTAKCKGETEDGRGGGTAPSLLVQVKEAGGETHYCSCRQQR